MRFKVGDKVRVRKDLEGGKLYYMDDKEKSDVFVIGMKEFIGKVVTIGDIWNGKYTIEELEGYSWVDEMFEPVSNQKIVITTDGTETVVKLYDGKKVVKSATAKCSPNDEFNFETGAKIAFERLIEETLAEEKPIEKKPKLKIEIGKRYMLKPYKDVTRARMLDGKTWNRDFSQPVEVIKIHDRDEQVFYVECENGKKWYVDVSSFLCECIDIETE